MYARMGFGVFVVLLVVIMPLAAFGEPVDSVHTTAAAADSAASMTIPSVTETVLPSLTRIVFSLLIIVAIIYASVFLLKKLSGNRLGSGTRGKTIRVIEQTYLAPKKSVCLLKLADRAVLIGITDNTINMLTEISLDDLPEDITEAVTKQNLNFQGFLNNATGKLFGGRSKRGEGPHAS